MSEVAAVFAVGLFVVGVVFLLLGGTLVTGVCGFLGACWMAAELWRMEE